MSIIKEISNALKNVKKTTPLVHNITNYVTVNDCANVLLALGASPVMADDILEVEEMVSIASSLVINIGTLNSRTIDSMIKAGKKANELGIPIILDPVGVGATKLRTSTCNKLIEEINFAVIRGNISEINCIASVSSTTRGVDATGDMDGAAKTAKALAKSLNTVIAITGKTDVISDGNKTILCDNGHPLMSKVTGTGCMTSALIGGYIGAKVSPLIAATAGIVSMAISGEDAYNSLNNKSNLGSFKVKIIDNISNLDDPMICALAKIKEVESESF